MESGGLFLPYPENPTSMGDFVLFIFKYIYIYIYIYNMSFLIFLGRVTYIQAIGSVQFISLSPHELYVCNKRDIIFECQVWLVIIYPPGHTTILLPSEALIYLLKENSVWP
jgi:hypothetical protein